MNTSNVIVIVLSIISLLFSTFASCIAHIVSKEKRIKKMSRIKVQLEEIESQLRTLPEEHGEVFFTVNAQRTLYNPKSATNSELVG